MPTEQSCLSHCPFIHRYISTFALLSYFFFLENKKEVVLRWKKATLAASIWEQLKGVKIDVMEMLVFKAWSDLWTYVVDAFILFEFLFCRKTNGNSETLTIMTDYTRQWWISSGFDIIGYGNPAIMIWTMISNLALCLNQPLFQTCYLPCFNNYSY